MFRACLVLVLLLVTAPLFAKSDHAVLKLCFEKQGAPFLISTKDRKLAEQERFQQIKESTLWSRKMLVLLDRQKIFSFKPASDSCIVISKIPTGTHTIAVDFKSASYTTLEPKSEVTKKFKADLLFEAVIAVEDGPTAQVTVTQEQDRVALYQTVDQGAVPDCKTQCTIPAGVPVYFMTRADDDKVECPVQFELIVPNEREKTLNCYDADRITADLRALVKANNIKCRTNLEYAFFRVYGEGCLVTLQPDKNGLRPRDPEIRLLPLDKQKVRYFLQVNDGEKKQYLFSTSDRKGEVILPKSGDTISLTEVHEP